VVVIAVVVVVVTVVMVMVRRWWLNGDNGIIVESEDTNQFSIITTIILNLSIRWRSVNFTPRPFYLRRQIPI